MYGRFFERTNIFAKAAEAGIRWVRYYRCQQNLRVRKGKFRSK